MHDEGAFVDEAGVELDEGGAGVEFFLKIVFGEDAAAADDGEFAAGLLMDEVDHFGAFLADGGSAESAFFLEFDAGVVERSIGCDNT